MHHVFYKFPRMQVVTGRFGIWDGLWGQRGTRTAGWFGGKDDKMVYREANRDERVIWSLMCTWWVTKVAGQQTTSKQDISS